VRTVANHFESIGAFVRRGIIEADVACDLWAYVVIRCWTESVPVLTFVRHQTGREALWENYEYMASVSKRWIDSHPDGSYPKQEPRMPKDNSLLEVLTENG
jgi:hypothetical protein